LGLFYFGTIGKQRKGSFVGDFILKTKVAHENILHLEAIDLSLKCGNFFIKFEKVNIWENPVFIDEVLDELLFITNKKNWGTHMAGGITRISHKDFKLIKNLVK